MFYNGTALGQSKFLVKLKLVHLARQTTCPTRHVALREMIEKIQNTSW